MKTAIIKLSGKAIEDFVTNPEWLNILSTLKQNYDSLCIVHGAGNQISEWSSALGIASNFINGLRVTDEQMMNVVAAVQAGLINTKIVSFLCSKNFNALGMTGVDNNLFVADYTNKELGYVGTPRLNKNSNWLNNLLTESVIPVFSSICRDNDGNLMNVNADVFTNTLASALKAETVFFVSDIKGVILNGTAQTELNEAEILNGIAEKEITGGMIPKLQSCLSLIKSGVEKVWIGNNLEHLFSSKNQQEGTWIIATN